MKRKKKKSQLITYAKVSQKKYSQNVTKTGKSLLKNAQKHLNKKRRKEGTLL